MARHGGDIYHHQVIMDYSVNVNPLGIPAPVKDAMSEALDKCVQYPDYTCDLLKEEIAKKRGLLPDYIVCGNGASDLFMGIVHAFMPQKAMVCAPSFYGYTYALQAVNAEIVTEVLRADDNFKMPVDVINRIPQDVDMIFLCNPNNPTGVVLERNELEKIIQHCNVQNTYVVLDECFLEFTGRYEELSGEALLAKYPNLIIVNAFTKTYAIPGVRLGYACLRPELAADLEKHLAEWRISVPALAAGIAALTRVDKRYMKDTIHLLEEERCYLTHEIQKLGITCFPSSADYLLLQTKLPLYDALLERGILIRHCDNYEGLSPDFYRIAVKDHELNMAFVGHLQAVCHDCIV